MSEASAAAASLGEGVAGQTWSRQQILAGRIGLGIALLALWQLATAVFGAAFVPGPVAVAERIASLVASGEITRHTLVTVWEAAGGFLIGGGLGLALPFLLRLTPRLTEALDPFITVAMGLPKLALAPLLILWFGIGIFSKVVFVASLVFFLIFFNTLAGVRSVHPPLLATARVFGASHWIIAREIVWNTTLPYVFAGVKIGLPRALSAAVVGEFIAADVGLGFYINNSRAMADAVGLFAGVIIVTALVIVLNAGLQLLHARSMAWRPVARDMVI